MRLLSSVSASVLVVLVGVSARTARAQGAPQQLPPPAPQPPPAQYQPPPQHYQPQPYQPPPPGYVQPYQAPPPGYGQPNYYPPQAPPGGQQPYYPPPGAQQPYYYPPSQQPPPGQAPPPAIYEAPEPPTHAPKFSLWVGPRLSYMGFGFAFYRNPDGNAETTGNLVGNGLAPELDLGARISYRYVPYLFWERGYLLPGHRFDGVDASATTDFYGIGFRFLSGDVDSVAFVTDLAVGKRVITLNNAGQTYTMSGLEIFRLGLGAEIRAATLFTIEPLLSVSGGSLTDATGTVDFAPNQGDGSTSPPAGKTLEDPRPYVMLSLGVGVHFDVFGK